jgi:hypothetical protein
MSQLVEQSGLTGDGRFRCGDGEALMTYVYGEAAAADHAVIAAHVARCVTCAEEIAAIGSTRAELAAWTPPTQTLGFQITAASAGPIDDVSSGRESAGATVLRPAAWWARPLPAWAQLAAAVAIFASGLSIGLARGSSPLPAATAARASVVPATVATPATQPVATREELARMEERLKGEIAQVRTAAPVPTAAQPSAATIQRVSQMIAASEQRQQQELNFRTSQLVTDFANRRKVDLLNIEQRLGATTSRVMVNQRDINSLAQRVAYPAPSPYVP